MRRVKLLFLLMIICSFFGVASGTDYTKYVNGFIGNADNGHTFPGACYPFGLVQVSPESGLGSWRYCSGYNYDDDYIEGFSQTHLNGTGVPDLGDVLLLPFTGSPTAYKSRYDKKTHLSKAGYYKVHLTDFDIDVELTATARTSFMRFKYNGEGESLLFLDLQRGLVHSPEHVRHRVLDADIKLVDDRTIVGSQNVTMWVKRQYHYVIKFDHPYTVREELEQNESEESKRYVLAFDLKKGQTLQAKVAISNVSVDGARASMEQESPNWNFETVYKKTQKEWNKLLSRIDVKGTDEEKINFYTSMYHLFIQPNNIADTDGKYRGADGEVAMSKTGNYYSTLSLWDTYRAAHPLYTILAPEYVDDFVQTMLMHHSTYGYLPIWTLWGKENYCMIGNHAIPVIVDAYLKGFRGFDVKSAYKAIKESSTQNHQNSDWSTYNKYGYYPFDIVQVESVSRTLESAYDDYCIAMMAKELGYTDDYEYFLKRSQYYKNLLDPSTRLMRGKDSKGNWRTPFDSFSHSHAVTHGGDYTEGNAWQYTWHVQHDPQGLIEQIGGERAFETKLDSLFFVQGSATHSTPDVTGLIGQYAHGNEPSHHVAYLYNYVNRRDKTQALIREIFDKFYLAQPDGLCGNDDCGQMSAWYIFSAMGFYPFNPTGGEYTLGAPQIPQVKITLPNNKKLKIIAGNLTKENKYVKSVFFNGKEIRDFRIHHNEIIKGGTLKFILTDKPSYSL